jgi:hypothetical protein
MSSSPHWVAVYWPYSSKALSRNNSSQGVYYSENDVTLHIERNCCIASQEETYELSFLHVCA